ncbi:MAG: hypothetical protein COV76_05545 [Candidatus Omnitrophica bacterium CG11_big_fil_rev_8_21_14_0_20_64_10]|nr:MAG: hypothetical protein COV76_05545 [Candidatus Omnitrophica bacterium CG11_big_fil_rev_8_21_14_0_20_64_10]
MIYAEAGETPMKRNAPRLLPLILAGSLAWPGQAGALRRLQPVQAGLETALASQLEPSLEALALQFLQNARSSRQTRGPRPILHHWGPGLDSDAIREQEKALAAAYRTQLEVFRRLGLMKRVIYFPMGADLYPADVADHLLAIDPKTTRSRVDWAYENLASRHGPFQKSLEEILNQTTLTESKLGGPGTVEKIGGFIREARLAGEPVTLFGKGMGWVWNYSAIFQSQIDPLLEPGDIVILPPDLTISAIPVGRVPPMSAQVPILAKVLQHNGYADYFSRHPVSETFLASWRQAQAALPYNDAYQMISAQFSAAGLALHLAEPLQILEKLPPAGAESSPPDQAGLETDKPMEPVPVELSQKDQNNYQRLLEIVRETTGTDPFDQGEWADRFRNQESLSLKLAQLPGWIEIERFQYPDFREDAALKEPIPESLLITVALMPGHWRENDLIPYLSTTQEDIIYHDRKRLGERTILGEISEPIRFDLLNLQAPQDFPREATVKFFRIEGGVLIIQTQAESAAEMAGQIPAALGLTARFLKEEFPAGGLEMNLPAVERRRPDLEDSDRLSRAA